MISVKNINFSGNQIQTNELKMLEKSIMALVSMQRH